MATVMQMHWREVTKEQYDAVRKDVAWETNPPRGGKYHAAWYAPDGLHVLDVWESQADFEHFLQTRLMPGVERARIQGQPRVEYHALHASFAPNP